MALMTPKVRLRGASRPADQPYDELDRQIIALLQQDGRRPNTEIAQQLGVTETTVRKRIGRLVSEKLIKVVAVPSPEVVGMTMSAIVGITVDMNAHHDVAAALEALSQTRYVGYSTGPYDLIIEVFFRSHEELLELLSKKLARIPGIIKTDTSVILKVTKFAYEWEIPEQSTESLDDQVGARPGA
jgi:Lrp/AsnC family transcriptional regulator, regulator for asnA, asnC and gidA